MENGTIQSVVILRQEVERMLKKLKLVGVGEMPSKVFEFGSRFNVLTGDNGLGKTFLLDIIWYALTRKWPQEVNPQLMYGFMAQPSEDGREHVIEFDLDTEAHRTLVGYRVAFKFKQQAWIGKPGRPYSSGLVIYAHANGGFSVWDPARNYWTRRAGLDVQQREEAYVFTDHEVWNGQYKFIKGEPAAKTRCMLQGLLTDLLLWLRDPNSVEFPVLQELLLRISPPEFQIKFGKPRKFSMDDVREIPTIDLGYGAVPVLCGSSAIKRVLALGYMLVWAFSEHVRAAKFMRMRPTSQITILFDEMDAHLHPKWQRRIMPALIDAVDSMMTSFAGVRKSCNIQFVASTHSPLVMASLEDRFDPRKDKWFDFDYESDGRIAVESRAFTPQGSSENWLMSQAFDLDSTRSPGVATLVKEAEDLLDGKASTASVERLKRILRELSVRLPTGDELLYRLDSMIRDCAHA